MKINILLLFLFLPLGLFAAGSGSGDYDIVERTINFLIFAGILYYLLADKIKDAYKGRIKSIADKLEDIQTTLKSSSQKKDNAVAKVQKARESAKSLLVTSKKETENLVKKITDDMKNDIEILEKANKERMDIEQRHMKRAVVGEVLDDLFDGKTLELDRKEFVNIILKKVA